MFPGELPRGGAVIETAGNRMRSSFFCHTHTNLAIPSCRVVLFRNLQLRVHFVFMPIMFMRRSVLFLTPFNFPICLGSFNESGLSEDNLLSVALKLYWAM